MFLLGESLKMPCMGVKLLLVIKGYLSYHVWGKIPLNFRFWAILGTTRTSNFVSEGDFYDAARYVNV